MNSPPEALFPLTDFSALFSPESDMTALSVPDRTGIVLLVSSDRLLHRTMHQMITQEHYHLVSTFSPPEAIAVNQILAPDLIFIDADLKNAEGFTCCQTLRRLSACIATPIVMLNVSDDPDAIDRVFTAGAFDYVPQPIHWAALRHRTRHLIQSHQAYRQLQDTNANLKHQFNVQKSEQQSRIQKLEQDNQFKDHFLNTVTHELRSPLSNMLLSIQLLETLLKNNLVTDGEDKTNYSNYKKSLEYLQILRSECEREVNLVNDLLDLQKVEADSQPLCMETIVWQEWAKDIILSFKERTQHHQQSLYTYLEPALPDTTIDAARLAQIIRELMHNACKYTPPGENIVVTVKQSDQTLCLSVSNSGVEIPEAEYEHIFERFYRIPGSDRQRQGGTGLGLTIVKHLVHRLHGSITLESRNQWTHFHVVLPLDLRRYNHEVLGKNAQDAGL
ncbi:hybrid sensor histidine kinase/response regulator [Egbenema bharatensis]|uniref:hybrid sensor histidine kinase/response regulator n=1 Tax=Egbenema bharatensis TaxID=3463334 RepID=UPI003A846D6D